MLKRALLIDRREFPRLDEERCLVIKWEPFKRSYDYRVSRGAMTIEYLEEL